MRFLRRLLALLLVMVVVLAGAGLYWINKPFELRDTVNKSAELSIELGTTPKEIAQGWVDAGVQTSPQLLYTWFRISGLARKIRAGSYEIEQGDNPRILLAKLVQGQESLQSLRLIEGWTFVQFRAELARAKDLRHSTEAMSDMQLMTAIGLPGQAPEGRFFPDTYLYSKGVSDLTILRRAVGTMQRKLDAAWAKRPSDTPLKTADEALVLASIIEKETGLASDRPRVAAVFVNRLRIGMPLQTDPTVIYGLGDQYQGRLRKSDLQKDTPFNTYTRGGLPPTPIAMPSAASLHVALHPAKSRALYFVSRGDGSSEFSNDLAAHNRAVDQYIRRK